MNIFENILYFIFSKYFIMLIFINIIGGAITWCFSKKFYKLAGNDLKKEAENIVSLVSIISKEMPKSGNYVLEYDNNGHLVGFKIRLEGKIEGESDIKGSLG